MLDRYWLREGAELFCRSSRLYMHNIEQLYSYKQLKWLASVTVVMQNKASSRIDRDVDPRFQMHPCQGSARRDQHRHREGGSCEHQRHVA